MLQAGNYTVTYNNCMSLNGQGNSRSAVITIGWLSNLFYCSLTFTFSAVSCYVAFSLAPFYFLIMQNYKRGQQGWEIGEMTFGYESYDNPNFVDPQEGKLTENVLLYNRML